jgi:hypothetical protein
MIMRRHTARDATAAGRKHRAAARRGRSRSATAGQSLVEFALVFPIFLTLLLSTIEFAFAFNAILAVQFATQNSALIAAEIGDTPGPPGSLAIADCAILQEIERDVTAPAAASSIGTVEIIWADAAGVSRGSGTTTTTTYTRSGSSTCTYPDGTSGTVPYGTPSPNNYPPAARCNFLTPVPARCPATAGISHTLGPDFITVRITYSHRLKTPMSQFIPSTGGAITFSRSSTVRMEPIL